jgi:hypothetical protein
MKKIEMNIECQACGGTGVYVGMAERKGAAVVCRTCKGTGCYGYSFSYNEFNGRRRKDGVERVYLDGMGYVLGTGKINYSDGIGEIDMDKEGVSYSEFLDGKTPKHIERLGCPVRANQDACHKIKGFIDECERLNGGWIGMISSCRNYPKKAECWKRFERS